LLSNSCIFRPNDKYFYHFSRQTSNLKSESINNYCVKESKVKKFVTIPVTIGTWGLSMNKTQKNKKLLSPKAGALCVATTKSPSTITNQGKRSNLSVLATRPRWNNQ
jgi:hypothetical protein